MKNPVPGRKRFSVGEAYLTLYRMFRSLPAFRRARRKGLMSPHFTERLMLAVTEVNQCAMCSYAHTKMALEYGMSREEVEAMLAGNHETVDRAELSAILFAQHYADTRAKPSVQAWHAIVAEYGQERSEGILGAIRMMMVGNVYGIALGSFLARISPRAGTGADKRNTLAYELALLLTLPVFIVCAALHAPLAAVLGVPAYRF